MVQGAKELDSERCAPVQQPEPNFGRIILLDILEGEVCGIQEAQNLKCHLAAEISQHGAVVGSARRSWMSG